MGDYSKEYSIPYYVKNANTNSDTTINIINNTNSNSKTKPNLKNSTIYFSNTANGYNKQIEGAKLLGKAKPNLMYVHDDKNVKELSIFLNEQNQKTANKACAKETGMSESKAVLKGQAKMDENGKFEAAAKGNSYEYNCTDGDYYEGKEKVIEEVREAEEAPETETKQPVQASKSEQKNLFDKMIDAINPDEQSAAGALTPMVDIPILNYKTIGSQGEKKHPGERANGQDPGIFYNADETPVTIFKANPLSESEKDSACWSAVAQNGSKAIYVGPKTKEEETWHGGWIPFSSATETVTRHEYHCSNPRQF